MKPLPFCANGCGVPPSPPSLVICRKCQDGITAKLQNLLQDITKRQMAGKDASK